MRGRALAVTTALVVSALAWVAPPLAAQQQCAPPADKVSQAAGWSLQRLAPERVWGFSRGESTIVAVVGTGVSAASPALAGSVHSGQNLAGAGPADNDCSGRDTFIAGVIAAHPMPGTGFTGIAPGAQILPIRVTDDASKVDPGRLAAGIRQAADSGARVIAVTVGTPVAAPDLRAAVTYALSRDALVVAAADADAGKDAIPYPAGFPEALAVAGIDEQGSPITSAVRPSLVAPGKNVVSIGPAGAGHLVASAGGIGVGFVAGAAALVRDYHRDLSPAEVRHRLESTADHPSTALPDPQRGYGVVNPHAAVTTVLPAESGEQPMPVRAPSVQLPSVPVVDPLPNAVALVVTTVVGAAMLTGAIAAALVRRARKRGWRSAWNAPPKDGQPARS
ncbi:S8 family serine peptidase [Saccharopolyspora sp. NPDC050389]|uniref:S8 family serine peptidase n=1 Tax=Saccharopolyspora sp. NPDC050389 TaxID=3155516 RepID=UPI0033C08092